MIKFLILPILAAASLQVSLAQEAEKEPKEDLGYTYILPLPILTSKNATESEDIGAILPSILWVDERCVPTKMRDAAGSSEKPYSLRINNYRISKPILINKASSKIIFDAIDETGRPKFKWRIPSPSSKESLTLVFSDPASEEKWAKPTFKIIDCSPKKLPAGSVLVLNYSHNELHTQIGKQKYIIKASEKKIFKTSPADKLALKVVALNGKRKAFLFKNYVKSANGDRKVLVVYPKPTSGSYLKVALSIADIPLIPANQ
ncbi:hypothetical protein HW115_02900 [Verrucomicrobiaceae bacterium N1E253]|uniref:DUF3108 domain-containing protein n=2 Tax=Oceaniferula marina TaxID=2748318 RepID=A0A851GAA2_9BACT|nr:hypothetical protein [Oceaniferula marina]